MSDKMKIVFTDTETTGLLEPDPAGIEKQPYIIEAYAVLVDEDFNMLGEVDTLIKPPKPITKLITDITKITNDMLEGKPEFKHVAPELSDLFKQADIFVAHNAKFDFGMYANEFMRAGYLPEQWAPRHVMCTVERTIHIFGNRMNLARFHYWATGKEFRDAHRAKNDVHAMIRAVHAAQQKGECTFDMYREQQ